MKCRRFLSVMLAAVMSFTGVSASFTASAEEQVSTGSDVTVENNEMTTESSNSLGDLFSDKIDEEMSTQSSYNGNYVTSVEIKEKTATVTYAAAMDCLLTVAIYDDSGKQMLASETVEVLASESEATVEIGIAEMPEYFYVRAYLTDSFGFAPLCEEYENPNYTSQMAEFFAKTVSDFDEEKVLNFDEDTTNNFAVFGDDVTIVEEVEGRNTVVTCDNENGIYVFENADETITSLKSGDILSYDYGDETEIIVAKIDTISVDGTTVTITSAEAKLDDFFDYIKVDEQLGQEYAELSTEGIPDILYTNIGEETSDNSTEMSEQSDNMIQKNNKKNIYTNDENTQNKDTTPDIGAEDKDEFGIKFEEDGVTGTLGDTLSVSLSTDDEYKAESGNAAKKNHTVIKTEINGELEYTSKISLKIYMDKKVDSVSQIIHNADEINYFEIKWAQGLRFDISLSNDINIKIPLIELKYKLFEMFVVKWQPEFFVNSKATLQFTGNFTETLGFSFGAYGCRNISENPTLETELKMDGEITIGVDLGPVFYFASESIASVDIDIVPAIKLTATNQLVKEKWDLLQDKPKDDHECLNAEVGKELGCVDGRVDFLFSIGATGKLFDCEGLELKLGVGFDVHLLDFYYSLKFKTFEWTKCPHTLYHYTVTVTDLDGNIIGGANVECNDTSVMTDSNGKAVVYLKQGENTITVTKNKYEKYTDTYNLTVDRKNKVENDTGLSSDTKGDESEVKMTFELASQFKFDTEQIIKINGKEQRTDTIKISPELFDITFTITDQYDSPVEGVTVKSDYEHNSLNELIDKTDANGKITLRLPNGSYTLTIGKEGYKTVTENITVADKDQSLEIKISGDVSLFKVKDQYGNPVSGAKIDITKADGSFWEDLGDVIGDFVNGVSTTDSDGCFTVFLKPGSYNITLKKEGYEDTKQTFTISQAVETEIIMKSNLVPVNVSVVDTEGNAVADATVSSDYNSDKYTTDSDGKVTVMLPPGEYSFTAAGYYHYDNSVTVNVAEDVESLSTVINIEKCEITNSGTCRDNAYAYWELYKNGTLRIYGSGAVSKGDLIGTMWHQLGINKLIYTVVIEDDINEIGCRAFSDCKNLKNVKFPDSPLKIHSIAFINTPWLENQQKNSSMVIVNNNLIESKNCSGDITIPDYVLSISDDAFSGCKNLKSAIIPEGIKYIGSGIFSYCTSLTSVVLPNDISSLSTSRWPIMSSTNPEVIDGFFENCISLKTITIPDSITNIGEDAFYGCSSLTDVYYTGTKEQWNAITIGSNNECLTDATIHFNSTGTSTASYTSVNSRSIQIAADEQATEAETTATEPTTKTAEFTALRPNVTYNFYSVKSKEAEDILSADNVLYIAQGVSDSNGKLTFEYNPREAAEQSEEFVVGMIYDINGIDVEIPAMTYTGKEQTADITVTYGGKILTQGTDYTLEGTLSATTGGLYEVVIVGKGNYYGKAYAYYEIECDHEFKNGVCTKCNVECIHFYEDEMCSICGMAEALSGDANNDGKVNVRDCAFIATALAKGQADTLPSNADFNTDGKVNVRDAAAIASALAKGEL